MLTAGEDDLWPIPVRAYCGLCSVTVKTKDYTCKWAFENLIKISAP